MNNFEKILSTMDFRFFGTSQHKIDAETFLKRDDTVLLDVRASEETETIKVYLKHHSPVFEIPLHELPLRIAELPRDRFVGIFCSSGVRSAIALAYLKSTGYENVKMVDGGYTQFMEAVLPAKVFKHLNK